MRWRSTLNGPASARHAQRRPPRPARRPRLARRAPRSDSGHTPCFGAGPMILEPKYLPKLATTVGLFTRYGLADFAKQQGLKGIAPDPESGDVDGAPSPEKAAAFRKRLVELGPAYVKLGQVLSTRPDLLPETY